MKHISIGGLDVSRIGLGAMSMSGYHIGAGSVHRALGEPEAAEAALQQAIETARAQGAKTFELRATTALGRLWAERNEKGRAHALLQSVCETWRDAEETVDVRRARACLTEWS